MFIDSLEGTINSDFIATVNHRRKRSADDEYHYECCNSNGDTLGHINFKSVMKLEEIACVVSNGLDALLLTVEAWMDGEEVRTTVRKSPVAGWIISRGGELNDAIPIAAVFNESEHPRFLGICSGGVRRWYDIISNSDWDDEAECIACAKATAIDRLKFLRSKSSDDSKKIDSLTI